MCKEVKKSSLYNRHIYLFTSCTMYMLFKKWPGRKWLKSTWVMCDAVVWSVLLSAFPVAVAVTLAATVAVSRAVASTPASLCGPPQKIIYIPLILKYQKKTPMNDIQQNFDTPTLESFLFNQIRIRYISINKLCIGESIKRIFFLYK